MLNQFRTYNLSISLYRATTNLKIAHHLKDQLLRAASSVVLNLAEGSGKRSPKDRRKFYDIAWGSLNEVTAIIDISGANEVELMQLLDSTRASCYKLLRHFGPL